MRIMQAGRKRHSLASGGCGVPGQQQQQQQQLPSLRD